MAMLGHRFLAAVGLVAYLSAATASGLLHDHDHDARCVDACGPFSANEDHAEHGKPSSIPIHDDDCPACQFAGQRPLSVSAVELTLSSGVVTEVPELPGSFLFDESLDRPRSRGPPA
jgi:hypothetical protein